MHSQARKKGAEYEKRACIFLESKGFEIIECNFYSRFGEIDLIAKRGEILHFIEVKGRKSGEPIYAITPQKIKKMIQTINYFLMKNHLDVAYCIDAICICGEEIEWVENITI